MERSVEVVAFDFGGVLYRTPRPRWLHRLQAILRIPESGILAMMIASPAESHLVMDIMTGALPEHEAWRELARHWHLRPELVQRLRQLAASPPRLDRTLTAFLARLRDQYGFRTAILTNAGSDFRRLFVAPYSLDTLVERVIISAEEGYVKPDERFYLRAAGHLGVTTRRILFVDDLPENVTGAEKAGIQAFVHRSAVETIHRLQSILGIS